MKDKKSGPLSFEEARKILGAGEPIYVGKLRSPLDLLALPGLVALHKQQKKRQEDEDREEVDEGHDKEG